MKGFAAALVPELRASPELPTTDLLNPDVWLTEYLTGERPTYTGRALNVNGAWRLGAVYACINARAEDMSKLPLDLYQRRETGGREKIRSGPIADVLRRPNGEMPWPVWIKQMIAWKLGWGQSFGETVRDARGRPVAAWPLAPSRTKAKRFEGVKIVETWKDSENGGPPEPVILLPGEYLHFPDVGFDGLNGKSRIELASQGIALGLAQQEWTARFYGNSAAPEYFISVPSVLRKEQRAELRAAYWEEHGGLQRARKQGFLWGGATVEKAGISPKDQELVSARDFEDVDVFGIFRVPPHKVSRLRHGAAFASIVESEAAYVRDALMPDAALVQAVLWWEWLTAAERDAGFYFEFNFRELLRGTPQQEAEALFRATGAPWMTRAEARERQNLDPGSPAFEEPLQPVNMATPAQSTALDQAPTQPEGERSAVAWATVTEIAKKEHRSAAARFRIQKSQVPIFQRAAERFVGVEAKALERALRAATDILAFKAALDIFYHGFVQTVSRELLPALIALAELIVAEISEERGFAFAPSVPDTLARDFEAVYVSRHISGSQGQIASIITAEAESPWAAIVAALALRFGEWTAKRPEKIARGASVQAAGFFSQEAYAQSGVQKKIWRQIGTSCPLCTTLDGRVVGIREAFGKAGDKIAPHPDHPAAADTAPLIVERDFRHGPAHGGCDCVIVGA